MKVHFVSSIIGAPQSCAGRMPSASRDLYFVRRDGGPHGSKSCEALIRSDWKLLQNNPYSRLELYNLKDDPREDRNVVEEQPRENSSWRCARKFSAAERQPGRI